MSKNTAVTLSLLIILCGIWVTLLSISFEVSAISIWIEGQLGCGDGM